MTSVLFDGDTANLGLQDRFQILLGDATRLLCKSDTCEFAAEPWDTNALIVRVSWVPCAGCSRQRKTLSLTA